MSAAKTALLVVDVQRGILAIPNLTRKKEIDQALDETVLRIAGLIERARTAFVPVVYVQHDGGPGHRLEPETPGWSIRPEIAPRPGDIQRLSDTQIDSRVQMALKRIEECSGQIRIGQLARDCQVGLRHVDRLLRNRVGFSPKRLARIMRFQALLQHMETSPSDCSTRVAAELGYFDQAHLANEVALFAGTSPGRIAPHRVADFSKTRCE